MTDRIDLDDREEPDDEDDDRSFADSVWRDDGPAPEPGDGPADETGEGSDVDGRRDDGDADETDHDGDATVHDGDETDHDGDATDHDGDADDAMPHVPRPSKGDPAGIPAEQGGGGTGTATGKGTTGERGGSSTSPAPAEGGDDPESTTGTTTTASGPHGGGVDDMTTALTYRAARRLANPPAVVADAKGWTDWLGIVGDVEPHVINRFQREHGIDVDFFSGSDPPGERLAGIGEHSMFYAERMVVVGLEGEDEPIAETADWEFVPLSEAAGEAGWELQDDEEANG